VPSDADIGQGDDVFFAPVAPASCRQAAALLTVVVDRDHRHWLAEHESIDRQGDFILDRLPKRPELLVLHICIDEDLFEQGVESSTI